MEHCSAVFASLEVQLQSRLELWLDISVDIVGDLSPNFHTTDFYNCLFHGYIPRVAVHHGLTLLYTFDSDVQLPS
jgi:hypothetical protein